MPACDNASLTVGLRMAERLQQYEQYAEYWTRRPQDSVSGHAALWWQHAGHATILQCHRLTRTQVIFAPLLSYCCLLPANKQQHAL